MALTAEEQKELEGLESGLSADESAELAKLEADDNATGKLESAGLGFAKGATLGALPIVTGAANAVLGETPSTAKYSPETIQKLLSQKEALKARGIDAEKSIQESESSDLAKTYRAGREATNEILGEAQAAHPVAFGAGNVAGNVATSSVIPGASTVKGMAALGATQGLAESEADLTKGQFTEAARNTAEGAAGGAIGGAIGKGVGAVLGGTARKSGDILTDTSEYVSRQALGVQPQVASAGLGKVTKAVDLAKDEKILSPLSDTKSMLSKVRQLKGEASDKFEAASNALKDAGVTIDSKDLSTTVGMDLLDKYGNVKQINPLIKDIEVTGTSPQGIEALKQQFSRKGWDDHGGLMPGVSGRVNRDASNKLKELYTDEVVKQSNILGNPKIAEDFLQANEQWGAIKSLEQGLEGKVGQSKGLLSVPKDILVSGAQFVNPVTEVVGKGAKAVAKGVEAAAPAVAQAGKVAGVEAAKSTDEEARLRKEAIAKILAGG